MPPPSILYSYGPVPPVTFPATIFPSCAPLQNTCVTMGLVIDKGEEGSPTVNVLDWLTPKLSFTTTV